MDTESPVVWPSWCYSGETTTEAIDSTPQLQATKLVRKRRMERITNNNGPTATPEYALHNNNNNHVKNERLSPGTPDVSSRSRSVTPSSVSHPDTPPASDAHPLPPVSGRNYSDFMRSLAAKYNNANPNDYFSAARNGFPPPLDPRFKPTNFPNLIPALQPTKEPEAAPKKTDFTSLLNPFANSHMFPPLIDMSTTQTLLAMVRTAKEAELQGLLKSVKRQDASSPLDLSAAAAPPLKRARMKTSSSSSPSTLSKRAQSESPRLHEDVSSWTVDDVCNFVSSIDICADRDPTWPFRGARAAAHGRVDRNKGEITHGIAKVSQPMTGTALWLKFNCTTVQCRSGPVGRVRCPLTLIEFLWARVRLVKKASRAACQRSVEVAGTCPGAPIIIRCCAVRWYPEAAGPRVQPPCSLYTYAMLPTQNVLL
ncbi:hypothetical protein Zmor_022797 [Zophobas morio]|uniref:Uncharacterized protein n=1 Tax=Zophobas morio TaxID=2755281 RepID=A0AA38M5R4_9CUCU|nr:hypothetical protein Zmor_022797 [Zophobas morio]